MSRAECCCNQWGKCLRCLRLEAECEQGGCICEPSCAEMGPDGCAGVCAACDLEWEQYLETREERDAVCQCGNCWHK